MLTNKQLFIIMGFILAFALVALFAVSSFGVEVAWFDGGSLMGKCIGSTTVCTGV